MIYDILEVFKKEYEEKGDKLVLGSYELKEGLYVKINKDERLEYFILKKKNKEVSFTNIDGNLNYEAYEWFKERDYCSCYLNSNKAFYDKKIHSINYLSLFVKIESFMYEEKKLRVKEELSKLISDSDILSVISGKFPKSLINRINLENMYGVKETALLFKDDLFKKLLTQDVLQNHFFSLCNYKRFSKPKEREILEGFQEQLSNRKRRKDIICTYKFLRDNLDSIVTTATENSAKNYIKIFFDEDIEKYKKESKIYYSLKIFNDIAFSESVGKNTFGLSNSNMGLNAKKPFLEHKTKFKTAPFLIEKDDALELKTFFDWLKIQHYKDSENKPLDRYLSPEFFMQKHSSNDEAEITDFDFVPTREDKFPEPILYKNHLWLKEGKVIIEDSEIEKLSQLEVIVDDIFYNKNMINNYYGEVWKKLENSFSNFIYITRDSMIAYFRKYDEKGFYDVVRKHGTNFVIENIKKDRMLKAGKALNLKISLLVHKGENVMNIKEMQKKMNEKLMTSNYDELTTEEFFYLCGQMSKYLINQSETHEKKGDMLEPFMRSNNAKKLKNTIEQVYFKYKHKVSLNFLKFNNAMSLIMAHSGEEKLNAKIDVFLVGALSDNIFYIKNEVSKGE